MRIIQNKISITNNKRVIVLHVNMFYKLLFCRILVAAMHYNENGMRVQAETKDGNKHYCIVFPKYKAGKHTTREVKVSCTYGEFLTST